MREVKRARNEDVQCYEVYLSKDETTLPFTLQHLSYDMIVMDRHMPLMDGLEAMRRIRKMDGPINKVAIMGLTVGALDVELASSLNAGTNEVLTKPIDE